MSSLWTAAAVAAATGGRTPGSWSASGVSIDTRTLSAGDLFVALEGPNHDAHAFVAAALKQGAAAAVVRHRPDGVTADAPLVMVGDTLAGLTALGRAGRDRSEARVLAVTGSVGKTGTKEALRHVLARQGPTHASAASHNNHWGVPLALARLPANAAYAVLELGMNHAGEIGELTRLARPHVALITRIAAVHLGYFASVAAIADAKAEIFEGLEPGGTAVLNGDDEHFPRLRGAAERHGAAIVTFGTGADADWRLVDAALGPEGSEAEVAAGGRSLRLRLGIPGRHWLLNSVAVLAAVEAAGADPAQAAAALADLIPLPGRGLRRRIAVPRGEALLLDESYNANPASMAATLAVLGQQAGRRVAVLGDMLELGEHGPALHAALVEAVVAAEVAQVFSCGPLMGELHERLPRAMRGSHQPDSAALAPEIRAAVRPGDVILVKGSLGSRMARVVEALTAAAD